MKHILFLLVILLVVPLPSVASGYVVSAGDWARPRHGESVAAFPMLRQAVRELLETPSGSLVIHFPGGEDGALWGQELHDWLVALGIPSERLILRPGTTRPDVIELEVQHQSVARP